MLDPHHSVQTGPRYSSVLQQSGYYRSNCVVKSQHVANCCLVHSCMMQIADEGRGEKSTWRQLAWFRRTRFGGKLRQMKLPLCL